MERVLIADDHPLVRDGLRTIISVAFDQVEVFEADTVCGAATLLDEKAEVDLVLLDLELPDAEGLSGLLSLRDRFPAVPIVIVSGTDKDHVVRAALAGGAAGFIPKSLKRSAIVAAIHAILAGDVYVPPDFHPSDGKNDHVDILRRLGTLTPQQRIVLGLVMAGKLNKQIAFDLSVSMTTVKAHVSAILAKLEVQSRTQAVIMASRAQWHLAPDG